MREARGLKRFVGIMPATEWLVHSDDGKSWESVPDRHAAAAKRMLFPPPPG